ncbi:MAG: hypothetical protein ACXVBC_01635 [Bdellovibrionota bacterium]
MQFRDHDSSFELNEIVFEKNKKPLLRESPFECRTCHGNPVKPIWDSYHVWPESYGSVDDYLTYIGKESQALIHFAKAVLEPQQKNLSGRYGLLNTEGLPIYSDNQFGTHYRPFPAIRFNPFSGVNTEYNSRLSWLNEKHIAHDLLHAVPYSYRYALLAAAMSCPEIEKSIPKNLQKHHVLRFDQLLADTTDKIQTEYAKRLERLKSYGLDFDPEADPKNGKGEDLYYFNRSANNDFNLSDVRVLAALRYLVEPLGVKTSEWSLTKETDSYAIHEGLGHWRLIVALTQELRKKDPAIDRLMPDYSKFDAKSFFSALPDEKCDSLLTLSRSALKSTDASACYPADGEPLSATKIPILGKIFSKRVTVKKAAPHFQKYCATCHSGEVPVGPPLPVSSADSLEKMTVRERRMMLERIEALRMPPSDKPQPSTHQRDEMIRFLHDYR